MHPNRMTSGQRVLARRAAARAIEATESYTDPREREKAAVAELETILLRDRRRLLGDRNFGNPIVAMLFSMVIKYAIEYMLKKLAEKYL